MFIPSRITAAFTIALLLSTNVAYAADATPSVDRSASITRADFVKLIVDRTYTKDQMNVCFKLLSPSKYTLLFTDVSINESYAKELCVAMKMGLVRGYKDGSFRPNQPINFAEAAKIYTRAFSLSPAAGLTASEPWFRGYVESLSARGAIPTNVMRLDQPMTYLTHEEILQRLIKNMTYLDSATYDGLLRHTVYPR